MSEDLCYATAAEALSLFRSKKLFPVELMEAVIVRCKAVDPKLNAHTQSISTRRWNRLARQRGSIKTAIRLAHWKDCP